MDYAIYVVVAVVVMYGTAQVVGVETTIAFLTGDLRMLVATLVGGGLILLYCALVLLGSLAAMGLAPFLATVITVALVFRKVHPILSRLVPELKPSPKPGPSWQEMLARIDQLERDNAPYWAKAAAADGTVRTADGRLLSEDNGKFVLREVPYEGTSNGTGSV